MSVPSMVHRSADDIEATTIPLVLRSDDGADAIFNAKDLPECKVKRNYSCNICDFFTQNPRSYLYHLREVHNEKVRIYECPNCLYASKHFQKLLRHAKMVHGDRQLITEDSSTVTPSDHDEEYHCSVCSFSSRSRTLLERHERQEHIKTKFFRCNKCTYATHMKARFTKHVKYHSMPMIKCDMCDFRTPYKWNLDRHCKNHNGRGAFKCSACNFTADIKQSLTVHEMNHHVPPVGQAAGLGVGRRRNKVGASDAAAVEDGARLEQVASLAASSSSPEITKKSSTQQHSPEQGSFGPDFINPDDIIHHANGNVYIKNKCKLCNFKSAWSSEMTRHEQKVHSLVKETSPKPTKKPTRPIPNLIPIQKKKCEEEPEMSQQDINAICAKSRNSALKDFAKLFNSEEVFENHCSSANEDVKVPDLIPAVKTTTKTDDLKEKHASFFDKLKEKLINCPTNNLTCQICGYKSKCLSEQIKHQQKCGKESNNQPLFASNFVSSSRCQYCRQRCKSSTDLFNHLQTCPEALKVEEEYDDEKMDEIQSDDGETNNNKPHPMENRVFVWNNIEVPMDIENDDYNKYDDNRSTDLSIRTQSPISERSENSYIGGTTTPQDYTQNTISPITDKIPTHGNDISVAQHKRVFKCPHCTFWASTASRFHVHIVGHLNKKPFECSLCSYRSNWRWDITKHIKLKSVRDPAHESAKVLMTDETGRRNYTKYNKYLTEIHVSGNQSLDTSGGSGTRPKHHHHHHQQHHSPSSSTSSQSKSDLPKLTRAPSTNEFNALLRPPPPLKPADGNFFKVDKNNKKNAENKRTLFKCKKCNFRNASRDILLAHVKGHYPQSASTSEASTSCGGDGGIVDGDVRGSSPNPDKDEASVSTSAKGSQAPFRCGHCNQVSNWKHVIQRHCRLKHSGDIRVVSNKNGQEKLEVEEQTDEPDHVDVPQDGTYKCSLCPFSSDLQEELNEHQVGHTPTSDSILKCQYCNYFVDKKELLYNHLRLHGISDPEDFLSKLYSGDTTGDYSKRFKCTVCPYVTNSKSQYTYHKQFHKPRGGQYNCTQCSYNVSKRHLLHQHLKVHGVNIGGGGGGGGGVGNGSANKQNGDVIDVDDNMSDEIEEVQAFDGQQHFTDIPLVWVSKNGKFSKMFKCRFCPHVNLRKVNIQEHEKMHSVREKNPAKTNEIEHRCSECNYVCNNAGVLSSHSKVHQGLYGTVHCLVDQVKSDEEQIKELSKFLTPHLGLLNLDEYQTETSNLIESEDEDGLYFCSDCPARFLKENEFKIHVKLHTLRCYYKCDHCTYSARQKPHLLAHKNVHSQKYQERSQVLKTMHKLMNTQPDLLTTTNFDGEIIWMVASNESKSDLELDMESLSVIINKPNKSLNVPLSGTELFQQKSEAEQKQAQLLKEPKPQTSDPQFGTLMHGNPNFVYPTYLKNGKMKEKRYKCHKCPSAFEKREQYKVHLNLHGSKQKYKCEYCDYSVKYYANYVQHLKKHKMNSEALAAREDLSEMVVDEVTEESKLSIGDQQAYNILQQRLLVNSGASLDEKKPTFSCTICPYVNHRKDAVDNHQKRHVSVSGTRNHYTCEHCDYSVPQVHFLRDHTKLHFLAKNHHVDGYMVCDNLKLIAKKNEDEIGDVIFEEKGDGFMPELSEDVCEKFNNNDGEKQFVNVETGDVIEDDGNCRDSKMDET